MLSWIYIVAVVATWLRVRVNAFIPSASHYIFFKRAALKHELSAVGLRSSRVSCDNIPSRINTLRISMLSSEVAVVSTNDATTNKTAMSSVWPQHLDRNDKRVKPLFDSYENKDMDDFCKNLKDYAYRYNAMDNRPLIRSLDISIMLENLLDLENSPPNLASWVWSASKLRIGSKNPRIFNLYKKIIDKLFTLPKISSRDIATALSGFSSLDLPFYTLSAMTRTNIMKSIESTAHDASVREIGNILYSLQKFALSWNDLSPKTQSNFIDRLCKSKSDLLSYQGSMTIYSLGLIKYKLDFSKEFANVMFDVSDVIIRSIGDENFVFNHKAFQPHIYIGLSRMATTHDMPNKLKNTIIESLTEKNLNGTTEFDVSAVIYALGTMGFNWDAFNQTTLQNVLLRYIDKLDPIGMSSVLNGLDSMNCSWSALNPSLKQSIELACTRIFNDPAVQTNRQAINNIIYALGGLGMSWRNSSLSFTDGVIRAVIKYIPILQDIEFASTIIGLGKMEMPFNDIPDILKDLITTKLDSVSKNAINLPQALSIFSGFSGMMISWEQLTPSMQSSLVACSYDGNYRILSPIRLSCAVYTLGKLRASWNDLPSLFKSAVFQSIKDNSQNFDDRSCSNIIYGLALMNVNWYDDLTDDARSNIVDMLSSPSLQSNDSHTKPQHTANILWGLTRMNATWNDLPSEKLMKLVERVADMSAHELANTIYSLAMLDCPWENLTSRIKRRTLKTLTKLINNRDQINLSDSNLLLYAITLIEGGVLFNNKTENDMFLNKIHDLLLTCIAKNFSSATSFEFSLYLSAMELTPIGRKLLQKHFPIEAPTFYGPSPNIPSEIHASVVQSVNFYLNSGNISDESSFEVVNEYLGFNAGVFPIDAAILYNNTVVAFLEIDGDFHYRNLLPTSALTIDSAALQASCYIYGQVGNQGIWFQEESQEIQRFQLRRKDILKHRMYQTKFPNVPFYRVRGLQNLYEIKKVGHSLAQQIQTSLGLQIQ